MTKQIRRKQPLTDIERQAITIWQLIHNIQRKYQHSIPQTALRTVRKASKQFLKNANKSPYNRCDRWGVRYLERIKSHLIKDKDDPDSTYLTWIQFQFHSFIHEFCPEYDPAYKDNRQPFYEKMIKELTA